MSYYDDCDDDEYSSDDDIFYHNYSVDYANQILGSHHAVSSCLPLMRRRHRRCSPRLVRVATLDHMPIMNRHQIVPSLRSRPKYGDEEDISFSIPTNQHPPPPLPSLEATSEELERRATRTTQPVFETTNNIFTPSATNNATSDDAHRPMTEAELRQVQQQQEAFQQHLMNMQRHLLEQQRQPQQQQQQQQRQRQEEEEEDQHLPISTPSTSRRLEKRTKMSYDLELDDDQAEIAELIETNPYFAAAMEDFAHAHGLSHSRRHRTDSDDSRSQYSSHSSKRHRPPPSSSSSTSSSSSSMTSVTSIPSNTKGSKSEMILLHELHQIRRLMERYFRSRYEGGMSAGQYPGRYPTDDQSPMLPSQRPRPPEPNRILYENVVNSVREIMDRRSPSQRDQPLKPSQIDPSLKKAYTRRPQIPISAQRPPVPPPSQQQQQRRRRSSQMSTPPLISSIPRAPPLPPSLQQQQRRRSSQMSTPPAIPSNPRSSNNIPPAPPYEPLANFSSSRSTINKDRNLAYGNRQKQGNDYDTLRLY